MVRQAAGDLERGLPAIGPQAVDVVAHLEDRFLVTYRAPAAALLPLVPAPFTVDARGGLGFVSVCALTASEMGPALLPRGLRFSNAERHLFPDLYFGWLEPLIMQVGQDHPLEAVRDRIEARELVAR